MSLVTRCVCELVSTVQLKVDVPTWTCAVTVAHQCVTHIGAPRVKRCSSPHYVHT
jgi:hypothetical protein